MPQMILIHLSNPLSLLDWTKSKIAPRVLVTTERMLTIRIIVKTHPNRAVALCILLNITTAITIDPRIVNNCTAAEMILMILANFLCFMASLSRRIAHRTDHAMRTSPINMVKVEMATDEVAAIVVGITYGLKIKRIIMYEHTISRIPFCLQEWVP